MQLRQRRCQELDHLLQPLELTNYTQLVCEKNMDVGDVTEKPEALELQALGPQTALNALRLMCVIKSTNLNHEQPWQRLCQQLGQQLQPRCPCLSNAVKQFPRAKKIQGRSNKRVKT